MGILGQTCAADGAGLCAQSVLADDRLEEALTNLESVDTTSDAREVGEQAFSLVHGALRSAWEKAGCRVQIDKGLAGT